jgi:hypothetical protein
MTGHALPFKCSVVISDVDGTLVTNEKVLTGRTKAAAAALFFNYQQRDETSHYFGNCAHTGTTPLSAFTASRSFDSPIKLTSDSEVIGVSEPFTPLCHNAAQAQPLAEP